MKLDLIFSTLKFENALQYVATYRHLDESLEWDSVETWRDLCDLLEIDYNEVAKGKARPAIEKVVRDAKGDATKVQAMPEAPAAPAAKVNPAPVKQTVKLPAAVQQKAVADKVSAPQLVATPAPAAQPVATIAKPEPAAAVTVNQSAAQLMAQAMQMLMPDAPQVPAQANVNRDEIEAIAIEAAKDIAADAAYTAVNNIMKTMIKTVQVSVNGAEPKKISGAVHKEFENILVHVSVRDNLMLVGPAGSGKTTVCEQVAEALSLEFFAQSVCAQTSKAELLGYMDANGNYVSTTFRKAYENGGVFVLDEVDAGNPNVIAVLNSALANAFCSFADGMVRKHEDFVLIACANTFGTGADRSYVGRNQLDAATLDRFSVIEFGYDEELEIILSGNEGWAKLVQAARKELTAERVVISPRATIQGAKLLAAGMSLEKVVKTRITKGMAVSLEARVNKVFGI